MRPKPKLTIGMISMLDRVSGQQYLPKMLQQLKNQVDGVDDVEVIVLVDNQYTSTGEKRNQLIELAQGDFICMVDDDDMLAPDYASCILEAIRRAPDSHVVVFDSAFHVDGVRRATTRWGLEYDWLDDLPNKRLFRPACHFCAWRTEFVQDVKFSDDYRGSDAIWVNRMLEKVHGHGDWTDAGPVDIKQTRIEKALYIYMARTDNDSCSDAHKKYRDSEIKEHTMVVK